MKPKVKASVHRSGLAITKPFHSFVLSAFPGGVVLASADAVRDVPVIRRLVQGLVVVGAWARYVG